MSRLRPSLSFLQMWRALESMASDQGQMRSPGHVGASSWDCCYCFSPGVGWNLLKGSPLKGKASQGILALDCFPNKRPPLPGRSPGTQQPSFTPARRQARRPCAHRRPPTGRPLALPHERLPLGRCPLASCRWLEHVPSCGLQDQLSRCPVVTVPLREQKVSGLPRTLGPFQSPGLSLGHQSLDLFPECFRLLRVKRSAASSHLLACPQPSPNETLHGRSPLEGKGCGFMAEVPLERERLWGMCLIQIHRPLWEHRAWPL